MPLFQAFSPSTEVSGRIILPVAEGMPQYSDVIKKVLETAGQITNVSEDEWYSQQSFLNALKSILEKVGPSTLFTLGKLVTESYPHQFPDLQTALLAVDPIYQANHRNGDAGYCKLVEFDVDSQVAIMECKVAYPPEFQRGVLVSMIRKYKTSLGLVYVEKSEEELKKPEGGDLHVYHVSW